MLASILKNKYKIMKFLVSGGGATVTNLFILYAATEWFHVFYLISSAIAFIVSIFVSFTLQKFWTFEDRSTDRIHHQAVFYLSIAVAGLFLNTILVYSLVRYGGIHYFIAQIISGGFIACLNFFVYHKFIFHRGHEVGDFLRWIKGQSWLLILFLIFIFLALRIPGVSLPYHQDEMKTALAIGQGGGAAAGLHHPPLTQLLFRLDGLLFPDYFYRLFPLILSLISLYFLYEIVRRRVNKNAALISVFLFAISAYGVLSSLMLDTDGAILPFFLLISFYCYDRWRFDSESRKTTWLILLFISLILGFLVKLSFILTIGAIVADLVWECRQYIKRKHIIYGLFALVGFFASVAVFMFLIKYIYPFFNISAMISHALSYAHLSGRNYLQVAVQGVKAIYYLSPLLLVPMIFISKEIFQKTRIFFIYLLLGFVFYFVLFDFSAGALDKYLMYLIIPLSAICGTILSYVVRQGVAANKRHLTWAVSIAVALGLSLVAINFLNPSVAPLYPKGEWFGRVLHFEWNMLNPFTGGSGPLGFYVSFLFIALSFAASLLLGIFAYFRRDLRMSITVVLLIIGIVYNGVFAEELLFGKINGSAPKVMREAVAFIGRSKDISRVITYNDSGAYELSQMGKYAGRFYAVPQFEDNNRKKFEEYLLSGGRYFLVVDVPHINPQTFYGKFFSGSCSQVFEARDGEMVADVYDCG